MVVEADNKLRNTAVKALRKQGYNVMEARSAVEALSRLDGLQQLDLLLANVDLLGGMNGQELAQEVCRQRPQTRLLFVSAGLWPIQAGKQAAWVSLSRSARGILARSA